MANPQHRCVFVGNIPYDATEEQLIQICEEVGPVVSFRLVIDRETGKPKGYGFCEYKDEETALSARRNLHGYDINGRQLRVDFAENDKNPDRSREQGRGGPGMLTNTGPQKQMGGPAAQADPSLNQPVGLQAAMAAAIVMAGGQTNSISQNGTQSQPTLGTDPLTLHLAKIPKGQLTEVLTELKVLATQNKEQARQLLLAHPQLSKAVLQAHIMLKSVPPHMLQLSNAQLLSGQHAHPPVKVSQPGQQSAMQLLAGLPPLAPNKLPIGFMQQSQSQPSSSSLVLPNPRFQTPLPTQHQVSQYPTLSGISAPVNLQSLHLHPHQNPQLVVPVQPSVPTHKVAKQVDHSLIMASSFNNEKDQIAHPSKLLKLEDGRGVSLSGNHNLKPESQKQNHELPAGVESALLLQVLNLTPEQLSSLSPEQQQQVIQLQQMLRKST